MTTAGHLDALLRPALLTAVEVARRGEAADPPEPAPRELARFLGFARLPPTALGAVRRVLDDDDSFRGRVAAVAREEEVGRAGWLFLTRPDGWQVALDALGEEMRRERAADVEQQAERTAARRLRGAEEARRKAEDALERARSEVGTTERALAAERAARRRAEQQAERRIAELERALGDAAAERDRQRRAAVEAREALASYQRRDVERREVERREVEGRERPQPPADPPGPPPVEPVSVLEPPPRSEDPAQAGAAGRELDRAAVARAVEDAAAAARHLAAALTTVAGAVGEGTGEAGTVAAPGQAADHPRLVPGTLGAALPLEPRRTRPGGAATPGAAVGRRSPLQLPPAVLDDSTRAAEHLVRARGAALLVDGYNASLAIWAELPIAVQRRRLVDALGELASRTGNDVTVVFDGAEHTLPTAPTPGRRLVRVMFSPPEVEADDVLLDIVDALPPLRSVVVASDDRRVRDGARRRGANLLTIAQLLAVLRRERDR